MDPSYVLGSNTPKYGCISASICLPKIQVQRCFRYEEAQWQFCIYLRSLDPSSGTDSGTPKPSGSSASICPTGSDFGSGIRQAKVQWQFCVHQLAQVKDLYKHNA
ncbi:hypothetical protein H671_5g14640 [Cricetulus griseus]|uniref:Uncharacterized protein n=1 Tax=Cricetulus griseus TaxID=10029 RepID=A0A061I2X5_CRIGR|nr:hypothetical protein H671_5g14640 [Cricetulus griseus]